MLVRQRQPNFGDLRDGRERRFAHLVGGPLDRRTIALRKNLEHRLARGAPARAESELRVPILPARLNGRRQDSVGGLFERGVAVLLVSREGRSRRLQDYQIRDSRLNLEAVPRARYLGRAFFLPAPRN